MKVPRSVRWLPWFSLGCLIFVWSDAGWFFTTKSWPFGFILVAAGIPNLGLAVFNFRRVRRLKVTQATTLLPSFIDEVFDQRISEAAKAEGFEFISGIVASDMMSLCFRCPHGDLVVSNLHGTHLDNDYHLFASGIASTLASYCLHHGKTVSYYPPMVADLSLIFPAILASSQCPVPDEGCGGDDDIWSLVVHLNDFHKWSREKVADWLDTLNMDLTLQATTKGD